MTTIRVDLGPGSYDVLIGPVEAGLERIRDLAGGATPILISEPKLFALHGQAIAERLGSEPILLPEGEAAKDWAVLHRLLSEFAERNATRSTPIVALGGGSVGDVAGLAASLFKRGCPIIHLPTTLLAQADSAIGGKTAIDAFGEKNLVGTFHQPALVVVDPAFLDTLDERQLRSGYAEVVKYGLIDDPAFFAWCEINGLGVLAGHRDLRQQAIETAIRSKARIVASDVEDRTGRRALLNLGHSFGHAIEAEAGLGAVLHGEAVALGIALAFRFSSELKICPAADTERVISHLAKSGLPTRLADVGLAKAGGRLVEWMRRDKKSSQSRVALVLARGIGKAFLETAVDAERLAAFLDRAA
ncbi:3-dehydroquinate synthase family protein [Sphingomonas sp.]|uniref:3-dehydroquinate synthase family protein n=1 Tax=Sphingomonas sp. TaxID=28214 RepID=UPI0025DC6B1E|nr:3-dehydroquinate synthase family protein [Sphingomonas sp.]